MIASLELPIAPQFERSVGQLVRRVEALHRLAALRARPRSVAPVEGVIGHDHATLVLHGHVDLQRMPELGVVIAGILALAPPALVVDLTEANSIGLDALAEITKITQALPQVELRLPVPTSATCRQLLSA
ncbi:MAG TPA: hypothetical protein VNF07_10970 [Acidimicrobiales bacterium]|nr:hypothetical protein [Acidimicrobiales bacterium]